MAVGYYTLTAAADPQTVCTAFEAEANITSCHVVGTVGEAVKTLLFPAATAAINDVGDVAAGDTTITYDTLVGEVSNDLPVKATIGSEIVRITADSGTVFTVERGVDGTVAAAHLNDAAIAIDGGVLAFPNHVVFRVVGTAVVDVTNAATAVGGVEVADGYPAVA